MRYWELLELYKKKELSEEQRKQVEKDIERHEAISEYLFEKEEEEDTVRAVKTETKSEASLTAEEFTARINSRIRKAFIKMGVAVSAVTIVIVLLFLFVVPRVIDCFYYDPAAAVQGTAPGEDEEGIGGEMNQMSLDMAVYTELFMPGDYRSDVTAERRGFGKYDISILQNVSRTGDFHHVTGQIERGQLKLYDMNEFQKPVGNAFGWFQMNPGEGRSLSELTERGGSNFFGAAGDRETATETLKQLDDNKLYQAYITFDKLTEYEDFIRFTEAYSEEIGDVWCAPVTRPVDGTAGLRVENIGFYTDMGQSVRAQWDREKYPGLILWEDKAVDQEGWDGIRKKVQDETYAKEHFAVMLDYMSEQEEFLQLMDGSGVKGIGEEYGRTLKETAGYVRENGLTVYGFACAAKKETLLKLNEQPEVYEIYTEAAR